MVSNQNILISLESRHARKIYDGSKKVELRRRTMHVAPGTSVWIYEKLPIGSVTGVVTVTAIHVATPSQLWRNFGSISGLTRADFFTYFSGVTEACALTLEGATPLKTPISLANLREIANGFQPPQFFVRLPDTHALLLALRSHPHARKRLSQSCTESCVSVAC